MDGNSVQIAEQLQFNTPARHIVTAAPSSVAMNKPEGVVRQLREDANQDFGKSSIFKVRLQVKVMNHKQQFLSFLGCMLLGFTTPFTFYTYC